MSLASCSSAVGTKGTTSQYRPKPTKAFLPAGAGAGGRWCSPRSRSPPSGRCRPCMDLGSLAAQLASVALPASGMWVAANQLLQRCPECRCPPCSLACPAVTCGSLLCSGSAHTSPTEAGSGWAGLLCVIAVSSTVGATIGGLVVARLLRKATAAQGPQAPRIPAEEPPRESSPPTPPRTSA